MIYKPFNLKVDEEHISCAIISQNDTAILPRFIFLHGAGTGNKEKVHSIAAPILENNTNILTLDFSGHGESSGELKRGSLKKRVKEAESVIHKFASHEPLTICGVSMGGFIAIKMLDLFQVDTLILFCPALYDGAAYDAQFDQGFTEIIRQTESWQRTDALHTLNNFTGQLLIVMGENDEVIPSGVIALINANTQNASKKELYIIPDCPHRITTWILNYPDEAQRLHQKISEYIKPR